MRDDVKIPAAARALVDDRDQGFCRMCGKYLGYRRAIHHINFGGSARGIGGRRDHSIENMISVCYLPWDNGCHQMLHGDKHRWLEFAQKAAVTPGVTVFQLARWAGNAR